MKDDAVERVLRGLGRVEAPGGLEGRVLRRLAESGSQRASGSGLAYRLVGGLALAGVLAWFVGVLGHRQREHTPGAKARIADGAERPKAEALGYLQATTEANATPFDKRFGIGSLEHLQARARAIPYKKKSGDGAFESLQATTKPALESFPAPPEPLTEQERLLRQIALNGSEPAFELLNEEMREAALAASDAEFEVFVRSAHSPRRTEGRKLEKLDPEP